METSARKFYGRLLGFGWLEGERAVRVAVEHTLHWGRRNQQEIAKPYVADMLFPYEHIVSLVRVAT